MAKSVAGADPGFAFSGAVCSIDRQRVEGPWEANALPAGIDNCRRHRPLSKRRDDMFFINLGGGETRHGAGQPRRLPSCQSSQPRRILAFRTAPPNKVLTSPPPVRHTAPTWGNDGEGRETHHLLKAFHSPRRDARPKTAHQREGQVHRPSAVGKWKRGKGGNDPPSSFPLTRHVEDPWWRSPKKHCSLGRTNHVSPCPGCGHARPISRSTVTAPPFRAKREQQVVGRVWIAPTLAGWAGWGKG